MHDTLVLRRVEDGCLLCAVRLGDHVLYVVPSHERRVDLNRQDAADQNVRQRIELDALLHPVTVRIHRRNLRVGSNRGASRHDILVPVSTSTTTLFQSLARSRPEWIAQGLFVHAVLSEPKVRGLLRQVHGKETSQDAPPVVDEERPYEDGSRSDVVIRWPDGDVRVELKLLAPFTPNQRGAAINLIVARTREGALDGIPCVTWAELVEQVENATLRELLRQVADFHFAMNASRTTLHTEFGSFIAGGAEATWPTMYRFLCTVHSCLHDAESPRYKGSRGWSKSQRELDPWYGYKFWIGGVEHWLGFIRAEGELRFALYRGHQLLWAEANEFDARLLSKRVVETIPRS